MPSETPPTGPRDGETSRRGGTWVNWQVDTRNLGPPGNAASHGERHSRIPGQHQARAVWLPPVKLQIAHDFAPGTIDKALDLRVRTDPIGQQRTEVKGEIDGRSVRMPELTDGRQVTMSHARFLQVRLDSGLHAQRPGSIGVLAVAEARVEIWNANQEAQRKTFGGGCAMALLYQGAAHALPLKSWCTPSGESTTAETSASSSRIA